MTSERAQAYGRVMKTVEDLASSKLHASEEQIVRDAADALFFCEDLDGDPAAAAALDAFHGLTDRLLESERLMPETVHRLTGEVEDCGPLARVG